MRVNLKRFGFTLVILLLCGALLGGCAKPPEDSPLLQEPKPVLMDPTEDAAAIPEKALVADEPLVTYADISITSDAKNYEDITAQFIEAFGAKMIQASQESPDNANAIDGFKLLAHPELVHISSNDQETIRFICSSRFAMRPLDYYQTSWWAGGAYEDEEDPGWIKLPMEFVLEIDPYGNVRFIENGNNYGGVMENYVPVGFIHKVQEIFDWFQYGPHGFFGQESISFNGNTYHEVTGGIKFSSYQNLKNYLSAWLSQDIIALLMADNIFIEVEGQLYARSISSEEPVKAARENWFISEETEFKKSYYREVFYSSDSSKSQVFQYVVELSDSGWRFTTFE